jgi:hypothetical protein
LIIVLELAEHAEHISDLSTPDTDISRGDVAVMTDMAPKLHHERLAKAHHLTIRSPFWIKIRAPFAAPHGETGERVLEDLLKSEELQDRGVDRWVEAKPTLIRTDRAIELNPKSTIYLNGSCIIDPRYSEVNQTLWLHDASRDVNILRVFLKSRSKALQNLPDRLMEFRLMRVSSDHSIVEFFYNLHVLAPSQ